MVGPRFLATLICAAALCSGAQSQEAHGEFAVDFGKAYYDVLRDSLGLSPAQILEIRELADRQRKLASPSATQRAYEAQERACAQYLDLQRFLEAADANDSVKLIKSFARDALSVRQKQKQDMASDDRRSEFMAVLTPQQQRRLMAMDKAQKKEAEILDAKLTDWTNGKIDRRDLAVAFGADSAADSSSPSDGDDSLTYVREVMREVDTLVAMYQQAYSLDPDQVSTLNQLRQEFNKKFHRQAVRAVAEMDKMDNQYLGVRQSPSLSASKAAALRENFDARRRELGTQADSLVDDFRGCADKVPTEDQIAHARGIHAACNYLFGRQQLMAKGAADEQQVPR